MIIKDGKIKADTMDFENILLSKIKIRYKISQYSDIFTNIHIINKHIIHIAKNGQSKF